MLDVGKLVHGRGMVLVCVVLYLLVWIDIECYGDSDMHLHYICHMDQKLNSQ